MTGTSHEEAGPPLNATVTELLAAVSAQTAGKATGVDVIVVLMERHDPAIVSMLPIPAPDLDAAVDALKASVAAGDPTAAALQATMLPELVARARSEAAFIGSPRTTIRHVALAAMGIAAGRTPRPLRQLVAQLEMDERFEEDGLPHGWVSTEVPPGARMATDDELAALAAASRAARNARGLPDVSEPELIEEGELRAVAAIGRVERRGVVLLQLTALEIRSTHAILTWRLRIDGGDDIDPLPAFEVTDDVGTAYRVEVGRRSSAEDEGQHSAAGEALVLPPIPPTARRLTLRMDHLGLDPWEATFPGARPLRLVSPIEVTVELAPAP